MLKSKVHHFVCGPFSYYLPSPALVIGQQFGWTPITFKFADIRTILRAKDRKHDRQEGDWQQTFRVIEVCLCLRGGVCCKVCVCVCICDRYWAEHSLSCWPSEAAKWQVGSQPFGLIMNQLTFEDQISSCITKSNRLDSHLWFRSLAVTFILSHLQWLWGSQTSPISSCFRDHITHRSAPLMDAAMHRCIDL